MFPRNYKFCFNFKRLLETKQKTLMNYFLLGLRARSNNTAIFAVPHLEFLQKAKFC